MTDAIVTLHHARLVDARRPARRSPRRVLPGSALLALSAVAAGWLVASAGPTAGPDLDRPPPPAKTAALSAPRQAAPNRYVELLDPGYSLGAAPGSFVPYVPPAPAVVPAIATTVASAEAPAPAPGASADADDEDAAPAVPLPPVPTVVAVDDGIPLPAPRPPEFAAAPEPELPLRPMPGRHLDRPSRVAALPAPTPAAADNRSFFDKLFGIGAPPKTALGYATPETGILGTLSGLGAMGGATTVGRYDHWTAVYDISAHMVYMPDGSKLEAHSGLGPLLDDPRYVQARNRGATPPHLYDLQPRERLFHGVQALRLIPVGDGGVFGRTGLLAHTYMLGPNGDSNGCVSFRDYRSFLQAFSNGQVRRLAVVARAM